MIERFYTPETGHSPLSNFYSCGTVIDGKKWFTLEHYFQAMKTLDPDKQELIRMITKPGSAKRMGRMVNLRPDWESVKLHVMRYGLYRKFQVDTYAGLYLLATQDELLVEGNNWGDRYWGVDGTGANWLGILLMARRAELRAT